MIISYYWDYISGITDEGSSSAQCFISPTSSVEIVWVELCVILKHSKSD